MLDNSVTLAIFLIGHSWNFLLYFGSFNTKMMTENMARVKLDIFSNECCNFTFCAFNEWINFIQFYVAGYIIDETKVWGCLWSVLILLNKFSSVSNLLNCIKFGVTYQCQETISNSRVTMLIWNKAKWLDFASYPCVKF